MVNDQMVNIVKVAAQMFFRLGIRSVSIDDICRELGMSKKTFYVYFESKDELITQLLSANLQRTETKMRDALSGHTFRQIIAMFTQWVGSEQQDVRRVPQLVYDLKKYYPRQYEQFQVDSFNVQQRYIMQFLEQGQADGLVRADINKEYASHLFAKIYTDALRDFELIESRGHSLLELSRVAMDILVRGVLSEEGLKLYK